MLMLLRIALLAAPDATVGGFMGAAAGLAHGVGRGLGILHGTKTLGHPHHIQLSLGEEATWRRIDGLALLSTTGFLAGTIASTAW
jgi:hypothetical protein